MCINSFPCCFLGSDIISDETKCAKNERIKITKIETLSIDNGELRQRKEGWRKSMEKITGNPDFEFDVVPVVYSSDNIPESF